MGMKYTQIPETTFEELLLNAGVFATGFTPASGEITGLMGATTGGGSFSDEVSFIDFGDDIDNCPKNTMELKRIDDHLAKISGTFVTITPERAKDLMAAADVDGNKITPRNILKPEDFHDIWWIGDYSDKNTGESAGYIAIHMMNALNTGGLKITSEDKGKGKFAFEYTAHYSIENQDKVPYEIYIKKGA